MRMLATEMHPVDGPVTVLSRTILVRLPCGENEKLVFRHLLSFSVNDIKPAAVNAVDKNILVDSLSAYPVVVLRLGIIANVRDE